MNRRRFLGSVGAAATLSLTGCSALRFTRSVSLDGGSYPQIYYDAANTNHPGTGGPETNPNVYWKKETAGSSILVDERKVYTSKVILDASDGTELENLNGILFSEVVKDGVVYGASSGEDRLLAFDAETGERIWQASPPTAGGLSARSITTTDDRILAKWYSDSPNESGFTVVAFDGATGEHLWTGPRRDSSIRSVAVDGDTILNVAETEGLYALSAEDGTVEWAVAHDHFLLSPTVANGRVYAISYDGSRGGVHAFDAEDGSNLWTRQIDVSGPPSVSEDTLYLTTHPEGPAPNRDLSDARLVALNAETGETRWEQQTPIEKATVLADGTLYVGGRTGFRTGMVAAYDSGSGEEQWRFTRAEGDRGDPMREPPVTVSPPAVVDGYVFITIGNILFALGQ